MNARDIDLATIKTWPAAVTEEHDGWFYLAAGGVTGRVNAVWPLNWTGTDVEAAINDAETWYAARGLPPRFKLTDGAFAPPDLPARLERRGYACVMPTLIMTAAVRAGAAPGEVSMHDTLPAAFDAVIRETSKDAAEYDERLSIALRAPRPAGFATIEHNARTVAIGMCAATGDLAGIFLMRTAPEARRQGLARLIFRALMTRCAAWGAKTAFLQVDEHNAPAIALYRSEGFAPLATYRFWRKA
ncbi:MAG: GNAT family N-acetyltransferase [Hyphomonadaceae bacterium]|nr:GNAT family N-acetyltransferase [Hyphomonadaceae bacterium]